MSAAGQVQQQIDAALEPLRRQVASLEERLDALSRPEKTPPAKTVRAGTATGKGTGSGT